MMEQLVAKGFYDIYPINFVPFWRTPLFLIIVGAFIAGIVSVVFFFLWRWYRSRRIPATVWDEALTQLAKLESYINQRQAHLFYQELTMILKHYLSSRYERVLDDKTDEELALFILSTDVPDEVKHSLSNLFKEAVALKFSTHKQRSYEAMLLDMRHAMSAINATRMRN